MELEYNKLTIELLTQGFTADSHPDYVKLPGCIPDKADPLKNYDGGFIYQSSYTDSLIYKTGCGKFVKGSNVLHDMGYMGIDWCHENDNPVLSCAALITIHNAARTIPFCTEPTAVYSAPSAGASAIKLSSLTIIKTASSWQMRSVKRNAGRNMRNTPCYTTAGYAQTICIMMRTRTLGHSAMNRRNVSAGAVPISVRYGTEN